MIWRLSELSSKQPSLFFFFFLDSNAPKHMQKKKPEKEKINRLEQVIALQSGGGMAGGFHMECIQLLWSENRTD